MWNSYIAGVVWLGVCFLVLYYSRHHKYISFMWLTDLILLAGKYRQQWDMQNSRGGVRSQRCQRSEARLWNGRPHVYKSMPAHEGAMRRRTRCFS